MIRKFSIATSLLLTLGGCLFGSDATADSKETATREIRQKLQAEFPRVKIDQVSATPIAGLYEVVLNGRSIVYVDRQAKYLLDGELVDLKLKQSLTQKRLEVLSRVDFAALPLDDAIKIVKGNGSRKLAVFADVDCPFCKRLEQDGLKDVTDLTLYVFLMPLSQLHPDAARKSAQIWCAADRGKAWTDLMLHDKSPVGDGNCETPLARTGELARRLGITGTPALVFASGKLVPGAIGAEAIERELSVSASNLGAR